MATGEIFLGSFFKVLFNKLTSLGLGYAQRKRINTALLNEWRGMLETIKVMLDDAEDKQLGGNRLVMLWLEDVRDLAYDVEDLLDEVEIEATQVKSGVESSASRDQKKWKFFSWGQDGSSRSNLNSCLFETMVQEISGRLENIVTRKARLTLRENATDISNYTNKRLPSISLPKTRFLGREKEEAELLELLIGEVGNFDARLSIVHIIGMGGVGKTVMAQRLYNDPKINSYFERKAWVCVSDVFDVLDITKTILQSITGLSCEGNDLNRLQVKLKDDLLGKKFLVVLDDLWNEKYGEWTSLLKPFKTGAKGSKIIITTRNHHVVSIIGASPYSLKELSVDNCTNLLAYHALEARNFERHPHLEIVGKKIAEKCRGLPLATKILGGLLGNKENLDEWEDISNNRIWDVASAKNDEVLPALKSSYVNLPSYLKRRFTYCAVFPKDYEFERDELELIWIAEGFLDGQKAKNILRLGRKCFDGLVSRFFLQQSSVDTSKFFMHSLSNDLAKSIADVTCFTSEESQVVSDEDDASFKEKARYASIISKYFTSKSLRVYGGMKVLRNLMLLNVRFNRKDQGSFIFGTVLQDLVTNSKYLRVLSLCHCDIIELPNCVCDLKYLQNLNLSYTNIKSLPESIGALCKLLALILRGCRMLSMLPPGITKLVRLQFLDIRDTRSLKKMPSGISNLRNLIILPKFVVGLEKGSQLKDLKNLPHLQGELLIYELQKVEEVRDAIDANLFGKQDLSDLFLHWNEGFGDFRNTEREAQVLHSLQPHTNIKNLTISYYGGESLPSWLGDQFYSKMVYLRLLGCPHVSSLPSLGQLPSLKELSLEGLSAIRMIGFEFYGTKSPFLSLTILKFEGMSAWKDWSYYIGGREEVPFPCLQHLVVQRCPKLTGTLPHQLDHLIKLEICSCSHLNDSTNKVHLPFLCELYINDCNKEILKWLDNLTSLTILKIENLAELVCFDNGFMSYLVKLKELHISSCDKLTYLWQNGIEMQNLSCLQSVFIGWCPRFTSFMEGEREIELPSNLERMDLAGCMSLERLPSKLHTLSSLIIRNCPKIMGLTILPNDPSNNNTMSKLESCDSWISFPFAKDRLATLKTLNIVNCKGIESLAEITAIDSLEYLYIWDCMNLRSLPQCLRTLAHLTHLEIKDCPALEMEDFPPLPIPLLHLRLDSCPKIKSLEWHRLTSLQELLIRDCENIECFPEGGLPPNLRSLYIRGCKNMKQPVRKWGLPMLTSLETLDLEMDGSSMGGEGNKECFPSEEDGKNSWSLLFPSSLTSLRLVNKKNVERLSSGLRHRRLLAPHPRHPSHRD